MAKNTLSNIACSNASNRIITPSTTRIFEISMINAAIPSIIMNAGINRCRTAVTAITFTVVVIITTITMIAVNTIMIIIPSTRLLLLPILTLFFTNFSMSTNPIMTTSITSIIANVCVNSIVELVVVLQQQLLLSLLVSILSSVQIIVVRTSTRTTA